MLPRVELLRLSRSSLVRSTVGKDFSASSAFAAAVSTNDCSLAAAVVAACFAAATLRVAVRFAAVFFAATFFVAGALRVVVFLAAAMGISCRHLGPAGGPEFVVLTL